MYEQIRQRSNDIAKISKNLGLPEFQVRKVKEHIFYNEHDLYHGRDRFDPHLRIAETWNSFESGMFTKKDLQLFKHELFEAKFEAIFKTNYEAAHNAANRAGRLSGLNPNEEAIYGNLSKNIKNI